MKYSIYKITGVVVILAYISGQSLSGQSPKNRQIFDGFYKFAESFKVDKKEIKEGNGINYLNMNCIRQKGNREFPYPMKGHDLITNPPVFTWPMADYEYPTTFPAEELNKKLEDFLHYDIQIGRTKDFSDKESFVSTDLKLPFYNNHKAFKPGIWYWRYRISGKEWSKIFEINITGDIPLFESPKTEQAYNMLPNEHPRIFKSIDSRKPFTSDQRILIEILRNKANTVLNKTTEQYRVKAEPIPATATEAEKIQIMRFRLRYEIEAICTDISHLLNAYQITEEEKYKDKAISLSNYIVSQDPIETYKVSDFTGAKSMSTLAMTYDMLYSHLNEVQKKKYEYFISKVALLVIEHSIQENIGSADGILCAHFFQHTFYDVFYSTIVMKGHIPEAKVWFDMLYDSWLSRSPGGGFLSDGVWPNGNMGYIHVNMESMVHNFLLYRDLFKVDLFSHPWYSNCANALAYTVPIKSVGDGFGDGSEGVSTRNALRPDFAYILGQELNNPFALNYAYRTSVQSTDQPYIFNKTNFISYRLQHQPHYVEPINMESIPQSVVFPQTGIVVMNTNVLNAQKNLFISFRSSPFGVGSHGLAEQNSFNVSYKGKPVFYPTGYRITTQDKHYLLAQKHSRARNTITVNGKTQAYSHSGYGWIARYLDGENITYTMGDASKAYVKFDISAINWITVLNNAQVYKPEYGFILDEDDDPKVKKFRRHLAFLRPNIIVVYDELESDKEVTWTFQLNGLERSNMKINVTDNSLIADTDNCDALAKIFASTELVTSLADTSYVKPNDWLNPQRGRPAKKFERQQFHSKFENMQKCKQMRFMAIIQIDESNSMTFIDVKPDSNNIITIGNYRIKGQLDINKEARLEIENTQSGEYLLYGPTEKSMRAGSRKFSHSTLLTNKDKGLMESIDCFPFMTPSQNNQRTNIAK